MKFKVGDRAVHYVYVNGHQRRRKGTIVEIVNENVVKFQYDHKEWITPYPAGVKTLRRLIKKERRRVWINPKALASPDDKPFYEQIWNNRPQGDYIEFIEVRK